MCLPGFSISFGASALTPWIKCGVYIDDAGRGVYLPALNVDYNIMCIGEIAKWWVHGFRLWCQSGIFSNEANINGMVNYVVEKG